MSALEALKNQPSASKEEVDAEAAGDDEGQDVSQAIWSLIHVFCVGWGGGTVTRSAL